MNNDIKEILDYLSKVEKDGWNNIAEDQAKLLTQDETKALLDYITNLQCDIDSYKTKYENAKENLKVLQEENKRIFSKVNDDELLISNAMNYAEAQDYKSRCEKAREYINHEIFKRTILVGVGTKKYTRNILDNVLNILNGGDKE